MRPKAFLFRSAQITCDVREEGNDFALTLTADCFAKSVCLSLRDADCVFSDNWFDIHGDQPVTVFVPREGALSGLSAGDLLEQLIIRNY